MKTNFSVENLLCGIKNGETGVVPVEIGFCSENKLYGLIDLDNHEMIRDFEFTYMDSEFVCGLATVSVDYEKYGVIKEDGNFFIEPSEKYQRISIEQSGVVIVEMEDGSITLMSAKTFNPITTLTFSSCEIIWEEDGMSALRVKVGTDDKKADVGVIRNDGVWLANPEYESIKTYDEYDYILARTASYIEELINIRTGEVIIRGTGILDLAYPGIFTYKEPITGHFILAILEDGKVKREISGYTAYTCLSQDFIRCLKGKDSYDVFCLTKNDFILRDIEEINRVNSYSQSFYQLRQNGLCGLLSEEGEMLIGAIADSICYWNVWNKDDNHVYFKVKVNGLYGVWCGVCKRWVILPQWLEIREPEDGNYKFILVATIERIGKFNRRRKVWKYLDLTGRQVIPEYFLEAEPFCLGEANVKKMNGKWTKINIQFKEG